MKAAVASNRDAAIYKGSEVEKASKTPVIIGAVMPARRDRADAMPVALPLKATGNKRGV
jgi:hypothetical protein